MKYEPLQNYVLMRTIESPKKGVLIVKEEPKDIAEVVKCGPKCDSSLEGKTVRYLRYGIHQISDESELFLIEDKNIILVINQA